MTCRILLAAATVAVVGSLSAACAEDVAPAARVGQSIEISNADLMAEAAHWQHSPTLIAQLQIGVVTGAGPGSYSTHFIDFVLTTRISFSLHNAQFRKLGLKITDQELTAARAGLFADAATTATVLKELGRTYGDELVADAARQFAVSTAMGTGYQAWQVRAFTGTEIEVNPRYGSWDAKTAGVVPPAGPRPARVGGLLSSP